MPYKGMKRKTYKRQSYKKKSQLATKSYVNKLLKVNQELKFHDHILDSVGASSTVSQFKITQINQGTTDQTRDGDACIIKKMLLNLTVNAADNTNYVRIIVYRWNESDLTSNPQTSDILQYTTGVNPWTSPYTMDSVRSKRFTVYCDKLIKVDGDDPLKVIRLTRYFKNLPMSFFNGGLASKGGFWFLYVSDSVASAHPLINGYIRFNFTDS